MNVGYSESRDYILTQSVGGDPGTLTGNKSGAGNAQSMRQLTVGGIEDCTGSASVGDGNASCVATGSFDGGDSSCYACLGGSGVGGPEDIFTPSIDGCFDADTLATIRASNIEIMKGFCGIDGDRGYLRIFVPSVGLSYNGPASGFVNWVASFGFDTGKLDNGLGNGAFSHKTRIYLI